MYFEKLVLHNFGIYKGTHEMTLSDRKGQQNITLIGGLNGCGKTTFLDSILLALYGKKALKYIQENARSYEKLLRDHINKNSDDNITYVAVAFVLDDGTCLNIQRSWWLKNNKLEQKFKVEKDGTEDRYLAENWDYYIEGILPFGIARFFFFNNERITQLADDSSFEQIKTSIKSAIGISTVDAAISHSESVINQHRSNMKSSDSSKLKQDCDTLEIQLSEVTNKLQDCQNESKEMEQRCQEYASKVEQAENEFWASGGNLNKDRSEIKEELTQVQIETDQLKHNIIALASESSTPLFLCRDLVCQSYDSAQKKQRKVTNQIIDSEISGFVDDFISRLKNSNLEQDTISKVSNIVNEVILNKKAEDKLCGEDETGIPSSEMILYKNLISNIFPNITEEIVELLNKNRNLEKKSENLEAHLEAANDKASGKQLFDSLKKLEEEKGAADREYKKKCDEIDSLTSQRDALSSKRIQLIKEIMDSENTNDDNVRTIRYAALSIEILNEFKIRLQHKKISQLSDTITTCFQSLVEKESLAEQIKIDADSLDVKILGKDGKELLKSQLSAGEQQMFSISVVWGLALTSGYKAPVIIDTPMARLDSTHRRNFLTKYLPEASSQVIVLSTDEEINGHYIDMIHDNIIDCYTLLYCEENQSTSIVHGYFGENFS